MKRHRFDLIYSFGYPWSCHVVGCAAQRSSGAPWVADYADPWTLNPEVQAFPDWRKRLDFRVESRLLRRASAVVVATPESQAFLAELFGPEVGRRCRVARVAQFPSDEYSSSPGNLPRHFQIAFTGLFNPTRQPYSFFDAAREFTGRRDMRICLAGLIDRSFKDYARKLGLEHLVHHLGRLGRRQTIELQQTSQILLSFGWPGGLQVPCKIYEYFAARRPILHIAGDRQDPAAALVRKYRRGLVVPNDPQAIRDGLRTLYELWTAGTLEAQFDLSPLDEFCLPRSLDGLEDAFHEVLPHERQAAALPGSSTIGAGLPSET
jgi:glycosyltransferase involved in cell wall biosynthesis